MTRIARWAWVPMVAACGTFRGHRQVMSDAPGFEWSCASPNSATESLALAIREVMRRDVADSAGGPAFRARYGNVASRDIDIVRDASLCARAGRAYVRGDSLPPARYQVALVRVGRRYIAVNMNDIRFAGEFMMEAVLDADFHFIEWIGT